MPVILRCTGAFQYLISAFGLFAASLTLFQTARSLGGASVQIVGLGYIGQSQLAIAGAVACVLGSLCLGAGSVLLDKRIRLRKAAVALPQGQA